MAYSRLAAGQGVLTVTSASPEGRGCAPGEQACGSLPYSLPVQFLEILAGLLEPSGFRLGKPRRGFPGLQLVPQLR